MFWLFCHYYYYLYIFFLFLLQRGVILIKCWEWAETSTLHISSCSAQHWLIHRGVSAGVNPIYRDCLCDLCIFFGKCFILLCEILTQKQEPVLSFLFIFSRRSPPWKNNIRKIVVVFCILSFCFYHLINNKTKDSLFCYLHFYRLKSLLFPNTACLLFLLRKCSDKIAHNAASTHAVAIIASTSFQYPCWLCLQSDFNFGWCTCETRKKTSSTHQSVRTTSHLPPWGSNCPVGGWLHPSLQRLVQFHSGLSQRISYSMLSC